MIVHGGIDNSKENIQNNYQEYYMDEANNHYKKILIIQKLMKIILI